MNLIINFLVSSFIAHGFLDFYTFKRLNDLSVYLAFVAIYLYVIYVSPDTGVAGFVVSSMYHFGQDFKYFNQSSWSGAVLFGTAYIFHEDVWLTALIYLKVVNSKLFFGLVAFSLVPGIIGSVKKLRGMFVALLIGFFGVIGLCFYMSLIHAPLAVYRFGKKSGYIFWGICTCIIMFVVPSIQIHLWTVNLSISIVMSHVVAISIWEIHQGYLTPQVITAEVIEIEGGKKLIV